jgi:hypothetical protein
MLDIEVDCRPAADADGWACVVRVRDGSTDTEHLVGVDRATLERLDPTASEPTALVRRSFEFLLAREPKESILRSFDLPVIGRYFPEWEAEIGG